MIAIVDVCSGNLRSVERAIAQVGGDVAVTHDPDVIRRADKLVVPGQGAFAMFVQGLAERGLQDVLREAIASGKPYLGICLGLQVLFESSEEAPGLPGLGVLAGQVVRLHPSDPKLKVPHIGWNQLHLHARDPMLDGIAEGTYAYFVHSYHAVPEDRGLVVADVDHGGQVTAAIRKDNIFASQFHPEKSQQVGLHILRNFVVHA